MEGVGAAASILAIAAAGIQVSIKLATFANQVGTAPNRIRSIASDVSLTASVLQQLSELLTKKDNDKAVNVFNEDGLANTQASADACKTVFQELDDVLRRASQQMRENSNKTALGQKIVLSKHERMKWPFLQPKIDSLRTALRDARATLMLMLLVTTLGYMKKQAEMTRSSMGLSYEQSELVGAILALHSQGFALGCDNVQGFKTDQNKILPASSPRDLNTAFECSSPNIHASRLPSRTQEPFLSSTTSTDHSAFDTPDRPASSETFLTEATTQFSMPQTTVFLSGLQSKVKKKDEDQAQDQGSSKDLNSPTLQESRGQGSKKQSIPETTARNKPTMEAWMVMPRVFRADGGCGYDLRWRMNVWPLESTEMKRLVRETSGWRKPDTLKQLASLTSMEREVVNHYLALKGNSLNDDFTVKGVGFRSMDPMVEPNTRMPWRSIQVLIARTHRPVLSFSSSNYVPIAEDAYPATSLKGTQSTSAYVSQSLRIVQERSKPQCWDHGCNGREFSTFSNLLKHQRETSGVSSKSICPRCGVEFTRTTARDAHVAEGACTNEHQKKVGQDRPAPLEESVIPEIPEPHTETHVGRRRLRGFHLGRRVLRRLELNSAERLYKGSESPEAEVGIDERQAASEGPFAGLKRLLVAAGGIVIDQDGNTVGLIVEGDPGRLVGYAVDEDGDIVDKYGNIKGHAKPIDEIPIGTSVSLDDEAMERVGDDFNQDYNQEQVIEQECVEAEGVDEEGMEELQTLDSEDVEAEEQYIDMDKIEEALMKLKDESRMLKIEKRPSSFESKAEIREARLGNPQLAATPSDDSSARIRRFAPHAPVRFGAGFAARMKDGGIPASDEKRKRNATASHRFRQRRKEKERENADYIAKLERQVREMAEERGYDMGEDLQPDVPEDTDYLRYDLKPVSPRDSSEEAASTESVSREVFTDEAESPERIESPEEEEESYEEEAERIIQGLLSRYTTLYDQ